VVSGKLICAYLAKTFLVIVVTYDSLSCSQGPAEEPVESIYCPNRSYFSFPWTLQVNARILT
jgi:hypothetical protein